MNGEINSRSPDEIKKFQKETDLIRFKKIFHKLTRRLWKEQLAGNWKELADWHPAEKKTTPLLSSLFKKRTRRSRVHKICGFCQYTTKETSKKVLKRVKIVGEKRWFFEKSSVIF